MPDLYTHPEIVTTIQTGRGYQPLWTQVGIGSAIFSEAESVGFEKVASHMTIAPIVVPETKGIPLKTQGSETVTLMPAYTKPQYLVRHNDVIARPSHFCPAAMPNKASKYRDALVTHANNLNSAVNRLKDYMTAQVFINGKVSITARNGANYNIDFNRPSANEKTLAAAKKWTAADVSPRDSLSEFIDGLDKPTATVIFDAKSWLLFKADKGLKDDLDLNYRHPSGVSTVDNTNVQMPVDKGWRYLGYWASMGVDLYLEKSKLPTGNGGALENIMPDNTVICLPAASYGVMGYGSIQDPAADYSALPIFFKQFMENDPAIPVIQAQSAPVPFCTSIESTGKLIVA